MSNEAIEASKGVCPYCSAIFDSFEELKTHVITGHKAESLPRPQGGANAEDVRFGSSALGRERRRFCRPAEAHQQSH